VHFDFVLRRADKLHFGSLQLMSIYMYEKQQQKQQQDVDPFNPLRPIDVMISTAIKHPVPDRDKPSFVIFLSPEMRGYHFSVSVSYKLLE